MKNIKLIRLVNLIQTVNNLVHRFEIKKNKHILQIEQLCKELNIDNEAFVIGLIGRLGYDKDLSSFLKVAKKILSRYPETVFALVGEGKTNEIEILKKLYDLTPNDPSVKKAL